ncbi:hypothetical protein HAX54_046568 [Datura stramonium]|uniref:mRNA capping enzyme adenylation domain-containing protein n=1 Tax=Datura stramonium TaxID=4076 RepID=A0ABS8SRF9_DATST|nr:hypothetical protein [Datura stramonium]
MQSVTGKGPDSQETSSDQIDGHGDSDSKLNGQQSDVHTPSPKVQGSEGALKKPGSSNRYDKAGGGDAEVTAVSPVVTKAGTDVPHKDGSDFSSENLFEGALTESKDGTSNILQSEAKIIEGFITALGAREKDVGEESPSAEGRRPGSVSDCPFIHDSGEPSSKEALPIVASPKWDGTPTQPDMDIPVTSAPLEIAAGVSSPPNDDEVPIHLVFKRKSCTASRPAVQRSVGTSGGPATRGTVKKSLDLILEDSRQNTLKRRRVTRQTVLDEESPSSPIVDLDCGTPFQPTDESSKTEKKAHFGGGISKKGKKPSVVGKSTEGPGAPVVRSKRKHVIAKSSKGKRPVTVTVGDDVKARVANIKKQKVRRKDFYVLSEASKLIKYLMPSLPHSVDGLIFQAWGATYVPQEHDGCLKWKHPRTNTVGFLFEVGVDGSSLLYLQEQENKKLIEGCRVIFKG